LFSQEKFSDRLIEQMTLRDLSAKDLAQALGISHSTVCNLRKGRYQTPSTEVLFALLEQFHCSADYMLGLIDFPPDGIIYHPPLRAYGARIRVLLKEKGLSQKEFLSLFPISSNLLYKWLANKTLPSVEYLIRLATFFDLSVDAFIQRTR